MRSSPSAITGCLPVYAPQPLRVLLVAPYAPRGGGMGRMMDYLAGRGRPDLRFDLVESRGAGAAGWSAWFVLKAVWRFAQAAAGNEATIVHLNMAERGSVWRKGVLLVAARGLGLRTLLHLHAAELMADYGRMPGWRRWLVRRIFRAADQCVVLGTPWRNWLTGTLGVAEGRVTVLRNGVEQPRGARQPPQGGAFSLLFLGNLLARKGLLDLLDALGSARLRGAHWYLVVAGGGPEAGARRRAEALGIEQRVEFAGWLARGAVDAALAAAGAVVLPSYHEGLPLALLEAASLGVPVVASPVGAIPELFTDGETALLVPPGDVAGLAAALHRLMADPALCDRLGRNGQALYQSTCTMEVFLAGLERIYRQLAARGQVLPA